MDEPEPEVSVVMPCLDEAETLASCILEARAALDRSGIRGEVIVADNGSTDGSQEIAVRLGARVVHVPVKGYGSALRAGMLAARGTYVVMGDADASYDFGSIPALVERLRDGYQLVVGNRFRGGIERGAMPRLHRWLGNPVLSFLGRLFFGSDVGDFHCGIRALTRDAFAQMRLQTSGMEFASEMIIASSLIGLRTTEIPVVLRRDGRSRSPHLRTWRDGWRHLRFMLLYSPRWLFAIPGSAMLLLGLAGMSWLTPASRPVGPLTMDINSLLMFGLLAIVGYQVVVFGVFTRTLATLQGLHPEHDWLRRLQRHVTLEIGLMVGIAMLVAGAAVVAYVLWSWQQVRFGGLDPRVTMRELIPAAVLLVVGTQTIFSSFFLSILGLRRSPDAALTASGV